jgi:hypothetical protein
LAIFVTRVLAYTYFEGNSAYFRAIKLNLNKCSSLLNDSLYFKGVFYEKAEIHWYQNLCFDLNSSLMLFESMNYLYFFQYNINFMTVKRLRETPAHSSLPASHGWSVISFTALAVVSGALSADTSMILQK